MVEIESLAPQPTMVEQAYRAILDAICAGRLEPGVRLTQESVAERLAVSRQPVGQALLLLKQQKFLVDAGRRGLMVAPLDRAFMRWIFELRLGIEPLAASLAAAQVTREQLARGNELIALGQQAVRAGTITDLIAADMRFHMYLCEVSGNQLFVDTMGQLWNHLRRSMLEVLQHREYRKAIWSEHASIQRALSTHDPVAAAALIRAHLIRAAVNVQVPLSEAIVGPDVASPRKTRTRR